MSASSKPRSFPDAGSHSIQRPRACGGCRLWLRVRSKYPLSNRESAREHCWGAPTPPVFSRGSSLLRLVYPANRNIHTTLLYNMVITSHMPNLARAHTLCLAVSVTLSHTHFPTSHSLSISYSLSYIRAHTHTPCICTLLAMRRYTAQAKGSLRLTSSPLSMYRHTTLTLTVLSVTPLTTGMCLRTICTSRSGGALTLCPQPCPMRDPLCAPSPPQRTHARTRARTHTHTGASLVFWLHDAIGCEPHALLRSCAPAPVPDLPFAASCIAKVKTRLALKPETTKEEVLACLKNGFAVDDSMYSLLKEYVNQFIRFHRESAREH